MGRTSPACRECWALCGTQNPGCTLLHPPAPRTPHLVKLPGRMQRSSSWARSWRGWRRARRGWPPPPPPAPPKTSSFGRRYTRRGRWPTPAWCSCGRWARGWRVGGKGGVYPVATEQPSGGIGRSGACLPSWPCVLPLRVRIDQPPPCWLAPRAAAAGSCGQPGGVAAAHRAGGWVGGGRGGGRGAGGKVGSRMCCWRTGVLQALADRGDRAQRPADACASRSTRARPCQERGGRWRRRRRSCGRGSSGGSRLWASWRRCRLVGLGGGVEALWKEQGHHVGQDINGGRALKGFTRQGLCTCSVASPLCALPLLPPLNPPLAAPQPGPCPPANRTKTPTCDGRWATAVWRSWNGRWRRPGSSWRSRGGSPKVCGRAGGRRRCPLAGRC